MTKQSIAVIGSGISGLSSAYFLSEKYQVKLYEKNDYLGGHSNTVKINYLGNQIAVDTGFIVFNHQTYPNLIKFFDLLNVKSKKSNMSFAVKIINPSIEYAGINLSSIFAQKKNIFNINFLKMLFDILKFNKKAQQILNLDFPPSYSIKNLLDDLNLGDYFCKYYLLPMASAIWSSTIDKILEYPALSFIRFFKNHGLLTISSQPQWYTVDGGSIQYVEKIRRKISEVSLQDPVIKVYKNSDHKLVVKSIKSEQIFDYVVFATHSDQVLEVLDCGTDQQKNILSKFLYQKNIAILHNDSSLMPKSKKAWASWVYSSVNGSEKNELSVTYWMNNLQDIDHNYPLFVTLNPNQEIKKEHIFGIYEYHHPIFDSSAIESQNEINNIQGQNNIYFCGAYQKYGFHEDGLTSAINVIKKLGVELPWQ